jgi:hypothetical protein
MNLFSDLIAYGHNQNSGICISGGGENPKIGFIMLRDLILVQFIQNEDPQDR